MRHVDPAILNIGALHGYVPLWAGGVRKCVGCGFLGWTASPGQPYIRQDALNEVTPSQRRELAEGASHRAQYMFCQRWVWTLHGGLDEERAKKVHQEVNFPRRCRQFFTYQPGATPERHLDFQEARRINTRSLMIGFALGIFSSLIAGLVLARLVGF